MLAWCAVDALGRWRDARKPEVAASQLFDALRLREPLAAAFAAPHPATEEHWRAAARLRASFAHPRRAAAPYSFVHDPDVAWVIGVHEYEGDSYLSREQFAYLLWWMALGDLLDLARNPQPNLEELARIEHEISARLNIMERAGYRTEALEDSLDAVEPEVQERS